jgi:hypothetical protein
VDEWLWRVVAQDVGKEHMPDGSVALKTEYRVRVNRNAPDVTAGPFESYEAAADWARARIGEIDGVRFGLRHQ